MKFLIRFLIKVATVIVLSYMLPSFGMEVTVASPVDAVKVALVLSVLNAFVKPVLQFLALPISCLTLGLFSLVISAAMVLLTDYLLVGFHVDGWLLALVFSLAFSVISSIVEKFIVDDKQ